VERGDIDDLQGVSKNVCLYRFKARNGINPLETEGILRKSDITHPKVMVPLESLSQYLSNEYQCYGFSIES
jgi:hypothetical protein